MNDSTHTTAHLEDTKGLICPLPLLRVKRAMTRLSPGDIIAIEATDEGSWLDFAVYCETQGHTLVEQRETDGVYYYWIEKGEPRD